MEPLDIVAHVLRALNDLHIPYMLTGSLASNLYGDPRFTKDADFVVQLGNTPLASLMARLGPAFKIDRQMGFETVTGSSRYHIQHVDDEFLIELFELTDDPHNRERFARRKTAVFAGVPASVPTVEDVVIQKLRWYLRGKRAKDILDVETVLETQQGKLDMPYIRTWCAEHGTLQLLEKALQSIPPSPQE